MSPHIASELMHIHNINKGRCKPEALLLHCDVSALRLRYYLRHVFLMLPHAHLALLPPRRPATHSSLLRRELVPGEPSARNTTYGVVRTLYKHVRSPPQFDSIRTTTMPTSMPISTMSAGTGKVCSGVLARISYVKVANRMFSGLWGMLMDLEVSVENRSSISGSLHVLIRLTAWVTCSVLEILPGFLLVLLAFDGCPLTLVSDAPCLFSVDLQLLLALGQSTCQMRSREGHVRP